MMEQALFWIEKLNLQPHPEGGWFKEIYRSSEIYQKKYLPERYSSDRNISTSIYYLLEKNDKSNFHRIQSDELWHFYTGNSAIEILFIIEGKIQKKLLGPDFNKEQRFQILIPQNTWFAAHLVNKSGYALIGCTVSPGFDFDDFELGQRDNLLKLFPDLEKEILLFSE
jgi:uncharacterized protein